MNNNRIEIEKENNLKIKIKALYDKSKQSILMWWLVLWSCAGIGIVAQFFIPHEESMTTYLVVWMGFWGYFEYKVIYAYRWRMWGMEEIILEGDQMILMKKIKERTIPRVFEVNLVSNLEALKEEENSFVKMMSSAYWNIGKESLVFEYKGKDVFFGKELDEKDSNNIQKLIKSYLSRSKSS